MAGTELLPGGVLSMTGRAADLLISAGNGDAALLYLWLLRRAGEFDPALAGRALRWDEGRLSAAHEMLIKLGLVQAVRASVSTAREAVSQEIEEPPEYTAADISRELEDKDSTFPGLVSEVQRRLGKILSTADLKALYTIYDFLALPAEVICLLVSYCVEEMERKYGPGHKPRMTQLRKEAFVWRRLGLDTAESAEEHLKKQSALRSREGALLPLVGITGRAPVDGERRYIAAWVEMGFSDEAIRLAYERTVLKKQSMSWPYMNSILRSWHQKGLHTVEEIRAKDSSGRAPAAAPPPGPEAQAKRVNDDIAWMREFLAKQKKEEG